MSINTQPSGHGVQHSASYWFDDGNIVLQVETTQYCVHQTLLAKDFPIFADAFSFTKSNQGEVVEGCLVVKVEGDKVEDWENALMVVYKPFLIYTSPNDYPIPTVLSILRLATKYESDHLRDMAATCLRNHIPCSLASWYKMNEAPLSEDYVFDIIETALQLELYSILPGAYLLAIRYIALDNILNGFKRKDGSIASLSPSIAKTLLLGRQSLLESAITLIINAPMKWEIPEDCKQYSQTKIGPNDYEGYPCDMDARERIHASRIDIITENPAKAFHCDVTIGWSYKLCEVCMEPIDELLRDGQQELWSKLPSFFKLPKWKEVNDFNLS